MTCVICEHKWAAPWDMQGKNVLCPDCKHRQKVPEQKASKAADWRTGGGGPSMAKHEVLENVTSARDTLMVSGGTLLATGVIDDGVEPVPLKVKLQRWGGALAVLAVLGIVVVWFLDSRRQTRAAIEFADRSRAADADEFKTLPLHRAILRMGSAEYAARQNDEKQLQRAIELYSLALNDLSGAGRGMDRDFLTGEFALSLLSLGGEGKQLLDRQRLPWLPGGNRGQVRPNPAEEGGVFRQLNRALAVMVKNGADFEIRAWTARRLARDLIARNHIDVLTRNVDAGFNEKERPEALGQIGLELLRSGKTAEAQTVAQELTSMLAANPETSPPPVSVQALWDALEIKGPITAVPESGGSEAARLLQTTKALLKKLPEDALTAATKSGPVEARVRALAMAAEMAESPGPYLAAAEKALAEPRAEGAAALTPVPLVRLSAAAARSGDAALAAKFFKAIGDAPLRAYATAEALRQRLHAKRAENAADAEAELPAEVSAKDFLAGHAWGRFQLARHNGFNADATKAKEYANAWPKPLVAPFGAIGAMLGVQDKDAP